MFCGKCGKPLRKNKAYCPFCGARKGYLDSSFAGCGEGRDLRWRGRLPCCFDFRQSGRGWQLVCGTGHRDRRGYGSFFDGPIRKWLQHASESVCDFSHHRRYDAGMWGYSARTDRLSFTAGLSGGRTVLLPTVSGITWFCNMIRIWVSVSTIMVE